MTKVLIAMDESAVSLRAAREAVRLFGRDGTEFLVINVARVAVPWVVTPGFGAVSALEAGWDAEMSTMDEADVVGLAERAGVEADEVVADSGNVVERVCAAAEEHDADVIVVGGHDKGVIARILEPSVSAGVIRGTYRPVLVVSGVPPQE